MRTFFLITLSGLAILVGTFFMSTEVVSQAKINPLVASVFFIPSSIPESLKEKFNTTSTTGQKIKILIVPGHEPTWGGAEYHNLKERDMAVDLANELYAYLSKNPHYDIAFSRNKESWNPGLETYFVNHWSDIQTFIQTQKAEMQRLVASGQILTIDNMFHNDAPNDVATRLYGVNRWADEQQADIVLHIHFNDSGTRSWNGPDKYSGLAIYVPEKQYSNSQTSQIIAQKIFSRLTHFSATSNLPGEDRGIIEDQNLIAIGSNNSLNSASILVEYGYIYEPQFANTATRTLALRELALQTYFGLSDFFGEEVDATTPPRSAVVPYTWSKASVKSGTPNPEILATQTALSLEGLYPPPGRTKNDCPINGVFGGCTQLALRTFQNRFNIPGNGTVLTKQTQQKLNELYGN